MALRWQVSVRNHRIHIRPYADSGTEGKKEIECSMYRFSSYVHPQLAFLHDALRWKELGSALISITAVLVHGFGNYKSLDVSEALSYWFCFGSKSTRTVLEATGPGWQADWSRKWCEDNVLPREAAAFQNSGSTLR